MHRFVDPQALDVRPAKDVALLARHPLGVEQSLERDVFAPPIGSTRSSNLASGKPDQGITIDHPSTHRMRYTRSSSGIDFISSSRSNTFGLWTIPSTATCQGFDTNPAAAAATLSLLVVNS